MDYGTLSPELPRRRLARRHGSRRRGRRATGLVDGLDDRPHPRPEGGRGRLRTHLRRHPEPRLDRREVRQGPPRHERDRGPATERGRARQGAGHARHPERRSASSPASASAGTSASSPTSASTTGSTSAARTSTRRSGCGATCGPARPSRSRAASIRSTTSRSLPSPTRARRLPIVVGGRAEAALRRAGSLGDGYHSSATSASKYADRVPIIRAAAEAAGRPMPWLTARASVRVRGGTTSTSRSAALPRRWPPRSAPSRRSASPTSPSAFDVTDPAEVAALAERFAREVAPLV